MNLKENYPEELKSLPVYKYLDEICITLKNSPSHFLVLSAETAAGKSTGLPFALLKHFGGKILMLEPRRLAVLNITDRVSNILGEEVGLTCGYQIQLESKISEKTRFTVLTDAILVRKLQNDPSLTDIQVVVIDEFHERTVSMDLALAFLKETMLLRDDLYVVLMSATIKGDEISKYLGNAPVYSVPGRLYPLDIVYKEKSVTDAVREEIEKPSNDGNVLVFLPGIKEIRETEKNLLPLESEFDIKLFPLHSSIPFEEQKSVLKADGDRRKIILSSNIAETSLTVPGVRVVIDSGITRFNVFNRAAGLDTLVTRRVSKFSADQRAGRAGRLAPGKVIRLWNKAEPLLEDNQAEILRTDLSRLVLECFQWGAINYNSLEWFEKPAETAWTSALSFLKLSGCIGEDGRITSLGKAALSMGIDLRLALVALSGILVDNLEFSTENALEYSQYGDAPNSVKQKARKNLNFRVQKILKNQDLKINKKNFSTGRINFSTENAQKFSKALCLLSGFPDRIAVWNGSSYVFPSGRLVYLPKGQNTMAEYLVGLDVDAGEKSAFIRKWLEIDRNEAEEFIKSQSSFKNLYKFSQENYRLEKIVQFGYGEIILSEKKEKVSLEDYKDAVCFEIEKEGLKWLPLSDKAKNFLTRVKFYCQNMGADKKLYSVSEKGDSLEKKLNSLEEKSHDWLCPFITEVNRLEENEVFNALYWYLDGEKIDLNVPLSIKLSEKGKAKKIVYEEQNGKVLPCIEVIIQQAFGCFKTPKIMGQKVLFRLLSPAGRPLQVTQDMENFWKNTWPEICSEMKGRYPKHNWDYRILSEE